MSLPVVVKGLLDGGKEAFFDAIVVLGSSFVKKDGQYHLGFAGKLRLIAALELLKRNKCLNLVLSGGKTKGANRPSEAEIMSDFLRKEGGDKVGLGKVFLEEESKDTSANIKNSVKLCQENEWKSIVFLSNEFHRKRVSLLIREYGSKAKFVSAEEILQQFGNKQLVKEIEDYYKGLNMKLIKVLEALFCLLLFFDKKGKIGYYTARVFRL